MIVYGSAPPLAESTVSVKPSWFMGVLLLRHSRMIRSVKGRYELI
jgi:hypothetical protein